MDTNITIMHQSGHRGKKKSVFCRA